MGTLEWRSGRGIVKVPVSISFLVREDFWQESRFVSRTSKSHAGVKFTHRTALHASQTNAPPRGPTHREGEDTHSCKASESPSLPVAPKPVHLSPAPHRKGGVLPLDAQPLYHTHSTPSLTLLAMRGFSGLSFTEMVSLYSGIRSRSRGRFTVTIPVCDGQGW